MEKIERILVVNRTSQYCREEVRVGLSVARKFGARLQLLHLISNPVDMEALNAPLPYPDEHKRHMSLQDEARDELLKLLRPELSSDFPIDIIIRDGDPADEIKEVVRDQKIDLIVLLAQEQGRLEHMLFGDNDEIIRSMPCSILLVKKEPEQVKW